MKVTARLLFFNLLLIFIPLVSLLYLDTYEKQLLENQERSMVQQGRVFASSLSDSEHIADDAVLLLHHLNKRLDARIRVVDNRGRLLADSARHVTRVDTHETASFEDSTLPNEFRGNILYRIFTYPINIIKRLFLPPETPLPSGEFYSGTDYLLGPEIMAALEGRYGAATRSSIGGQRSLNLYSAIPIFKGLDQVIGAVLVSKSTYQILNDLYKFRLDIIRIFLLAIIMAVILSLFLARRITVPMAILSHQAENVLDRQGLFGEHFKEIKTKDEIGDLSRALKTLSERLEKKIRFIDSMAADLVHELKNPVSSIRTSSELALTAGDEDKAIFLDRVNSELNRMDRLLDRLREISRIGAELEGEERIDLELITFINLIIDNYRSRRRIQFIHDEEEIHWEINPDRMIQIVTNLLDNALSFSPDDGIVEIGLSSKNHRICLSVADKGPGISRGAEKAIFNRFYSDRIEKGNHSGLGLAIVKEIVEGYGGEITVENREEGGALFRVEFP